MCWRERLLDDYANAARKWDAAAASRPRFEAYFVDSCRNLSHPHPFETARLRRIPFQQRRRALDRFYLTGVEMAQVEAVLTHLPVRCTHVVKLTGKYYAPSLPPYLDTLASAPPVLAVQARGPTYKGWSSELFVASRALLELAVRTHSSFARSEKWLMHTRRTLMALGIDVRQMPRFDLDRAMQRSGDFRRMTWL